MTNLPKAKGTLAETALVQWLRAQQHCGAKRQPLSGHKDIGDVVSHSGRVIWEVKNYSGNAATGQPGEKQLATWLAQADVERVNARARFGVLVVKRKGTTDVGKWWAYMGANDVGVAMGIDNPPDVPGWICMSVASMFALLRGEL